MIRQVTQIAAVLGILAAMSSHIPGIKAEATPEGCSITSKVLGWSLDQIRSSPLVKVRQLSCKEIVSLQAAVPDTLEITTGRISGKPVICISSVRSRPCQHILADLPDGGDPTSMLAEIFDYQQNPEVLNETVERLFIRPAKYIK